MINQSLEESGGITTLKLARGSISSTSPPRSVSTLGSWMSFGREHSTNLPDIELDPAVLQLLDGVGVLELLKQDDRPTFIIDLENEANYNPGTLQILFTNASLRAYDSILDMVMGKADLDSPGVVVHNTFPEFKGWALSYVKNHESLDVVLPSFLYGGLTWTCSTLKKRLRVISGSSRALPKISARSTSGSNGVLTNGLLGRRPAKSPLREVTEPPDYFGDLQNVRRSSEDQPISGISRLTESPPLMDPSSGWASSDSNRRPSVDTSFPYVGPTSASLMSQAPLPGLNTKSISLPSFDWTRLPMSPALPRHIQFARSIDWAATSLGPIENWSYDLRAMANLVMGSPHPCAMYWGDDYVAIYNEAYVLLAGEKHPALMGMSYKVAWQEIWDLGISDVFENARVSGQATMKDDDLFFMKRSGSAGNLEECYFSWSIVPLVGEHGQIAGLMNPAFEKTRRKIAERRMLTLREVGEKVAAARDVKGFWTQVIKGLEYNEYDVPFVFLYSVVDEVDSDISSMHSGSHAPNPQVLLEGTLGVPPVHPTRSSPLDLKTSEEAWSPYLREAMKIDKPVLLNSEDGLLSELIFGLECRGFQEPCSSVVVCPIHPMSGESILGFLVMGVNPRRPYDDDYQLFIQLLSRQLATSMASVVLFEEEIRRGQRAARLAALDRIELSKQLDLRTQEVAESETKFTRMAEFAPVGMFIADSCGEITYSNDTWWGITRHPRHDHSQNTWMDSVKDEDQDAVKSVWSKLVTDKVPVTHEFRVKAPWQDKNGSRGDTWVLMSAYPEKNAQGGLKSVFGSLTDISQQKWAEDFQKRRMEEAIELKRQQENFIDITSHEMRNPLSAILQCADEITTTLSEYRARDEELSQTVKDIFDSSIDAAQTIALCAQHQKRIVDDVLTLSKLDSALLLVTPVDAQPVAVVQRALKMFEGELETNDINLEFQIEQSYRDLGIDWVKLDPSRLLQVLINLTTNAIKFTHEQDKRTIVVSIGASEDRQSLLSSGSTGKKEVHPDVSYFPTRSKWHDMTAGEDWGIGKEIYLYFVVKDTGRGLDENEKKLLFLRFSQASPRTHVQYGGSGLGLFISRELTELQGGEIGVASERGVGSTFAFYIKARQTTAPDSTPAPSPPMLRKNSSGRSFLSPADHHRNSARKTANTAASLSEQGVSTTRAGTSFFDRGMLQVLIVEDNLVNQRVLQKQLRNMGFSTDVANHGGEALNMLKQSHFWAGNEKTGLNLTAILMDLEMPVMDGLTCTRKIRKLEEDGTIVRHVPIIAVTANARLEQVEMALTAGMVRFSQLACDPKLIRWVGRCCFKTV
jgi:PAS domain S-box-containing protein